MGSNYINFSFHNLEYDAYHYSGDFSARDYDVSCGFYYDRQTDECKIIKCSKPEEEILPLPIWWLDRKLKENGVLRETEFRICY